MRRHSMDSRFVFVLTIVVNLLSYSLIALWYVVPWLATKPRYSALLPLIFVNTFRTVGLTFIVPQVTDPRLPAAFAFPAAYGDLLAVGLAFLAIFALRARMRFALPLVWVFNLEGTADLLYALVQGGLLQFPTFQVGAAWFIPTFYVTLLLVVHILIFWVLLRPQPSAHSSPTY